jgi:hypothetical protein
MAAGGQQTLHPELGLFRQTWLIESSPSGLFQSNFWIES